MIKKLFDWTPRDIATWERLRRRGLGHFALYYGLLATGGGLFAALGAGTLLLGSIRLVQTGAAFNPSAMLFLGMKLLAVLVICLPAGALNAVLTWTVEESLYRKFTARLAGSADFQEKA